LFYEWGAKRICFYQGSIPYLEPLLEELEPVVTPEQVLQIDEHATLFSRISGPLTHTCTKGDAIYEKLKTNDNYVEREILYSDRSF
jgi:hypothetical protein